MCLESAGLRLVPNNISFEVFVEGVVVVSLSINRSRGQQWFVMVMVNDGVYVGPW